MSRALYLLQQDCIKNGERLDVMRELVDELLEELADGSGSLVRFSDDLRKAKKLLKYTGADNNGRN